jgi:hypothetical protein
VRVVTVRVVKVQVGKVRVVNARAVKALDVRARAALVAASVWLASVGPALAAPVAEIPEAGTGEASSPAEPDEPGEPGEPTAVADALSLDPGATCLEHDRLVEQVVTWLERDELDPRLTVVVEGDAIETRTLRFTLQDRGQPIAERTFAPGPSSCDDLHSVVALAIALAVDATVLESVGIAPAPVVEPLPAPAPLPAPDPVSTAAIEPSPLAELAPRRSPWALRAQLRGLLTVGVPPTLGGGGQLGLELGWRDLVDVQLGAFATSSGPQPVDEATLTITLVAARADVCVGPQLRRVRPRLCGGVLGGSALAQARGFRDDYRTTLPWVAVALGGDVRVGLGPRTALSFGLDGLVSVVRPVFDVREDFQVRQLRDLPRFGATIGMGVVVVLR